MPGPVTSPGAHASALEGLPSDVSELCTIAQGLILHRNWAPAYHVELPQERQLDAQARSFPRMLERIFELDPRPLTETREPEKLAPQMHENGDGLHVHTAPPLIHGSSQLASWIAILNGGIASLVPGRSFDPIASLDAPILKGSSGILAFTQAETARPKEYPCIRCGRCVEACPYFLNPSRLARLARAHLFEEMKAFNVGECVECGSCTYSCPSGIPIVQLIRTAKDSMRRSQGQQQ